MVTLAFDTATAMATVALVRDDDVVGERQTRAVKLLEDVEELLAVQPVSDLFERGLQRGRQRRDLHVGELGL